MMSLASHLLCVENEAGKLAVYDLDTLQKRDEFVFPVPLSMVEFTADGKWLFVLSSEQKAYVLDVANAATALAP